MRLVAIAATASVAVALCASFAQAADFVCQDTLNTYNTFVNVGKFQQAADATLTEDVKYIIPGPIDKDSTGTKICPYCGVYDGQKSVVSLFQEGFLGHFTIVNPLVNLRQISCPTCGPSKTPRALNFNQESFVTLPSKTKGGKGVYFSVPVIHDFLFSPDCKIKQMTLFQDPYTVVQVYAGYPANVAPIMPFVVFAAPPNKHFSTQSVLDFQVFQGEADITENLQGIVTKYYTQLRNNGGLLSKDTVGDFFMPQDFSVAQATASMLVPGDPLLVPHAGYFVGYDEIIQAHQLKAKAVTENTPLDASDAMIVQQGGSLAYSWTLTGKSTKTGKQYTCTAVDYFQFYQTSAGARIGRLTRFYDTYALSMAITNGVMFPQYASAAGSGNGGKSSAKRGNADTGWIVAGWLLFAIAAVTSIVLGMLYRKSLNKLASNSGPDYEDFS